VQALIEVILPVFLVIGFGYAVAKFGVLSDAGIDVLMKFAQNIAIPCLLFRAMSTLDLHQGFSVPLLLAYYGGSTAGFALGLIGARVLFRRNWTDSVAIGFCCLFSNAVLLGLAITERAYGHAALTGNYAIIALQAPYSYALGVTAMEMARNAGGGLGPTFLRILKSLLRNVFVVSIGIGLIFNLAHLPTPGVVAEALDMMVRAAIPVAIFGLGGVLVRYRPEGDLRTVLMVCAIALLVHPAVTWVIALAFHLDRDAFRSAVMTASMAPGVNAYIFANMFGAARRVAASSVLIATGLSILTIWMWLGILP